MPDPVLSTSDRFELVRTQEGNPAAPVVVKRLAQGARGDAPWAELCNEAQILQRLQAAPGCVQLVRVDPAQRQLVLQDFGGVAWDRARLLGRVGLAQFLALAAQLSEALADIHARGITHKDINPTNVLVRPESLLIQVIDFGLATTFTDEHPEFEHQNKIRGTLAYISPEQTGRMNRTVDYRTDLYALGCTLYHLATGVVPFADSDPLSLIHAHLARAPRPPNEVASWLPDALSELILDLMAKEPDLRYQSAAGVAADLRLFVKKLELGEPLESVVRRQNDRMLSPRPPRRLYGRSHEIEALHDSFAKALRGGSQGLLVKGYSGVGKTSLVHEIHSQITIHQGFFISGKFDQFLSQPFSAPAQCLRQLCQLLLSESDESVEHWRQRILDAVGVDAAALFAVVPELRVLLGPQPDAAELGPIESQVRLRGLLVALIGAVTAPKHPLVLFVDDLQWADQPSLDFIAALLQESRLNGLMLIGAYRDNEVDASHPLTTLLRGLAAGGLVVPTLTLYSLALSDTTDLLADMLHVLQDSIAPLADVVYAKTGGNPFYTVEFLNTIYRDGVLTLIPQTGVWQWNAALLGASSASDSVVDFLTQRLSRLPEDTQQVLLTAACLGNAFEMGVLAIAADTLPEALITRLLPALERGILVTPSAVRFAQGDADLAIRFCHDRMQQVAYTLFSPEQRLALTLQMARRFASYSDSPALALRAAQHYMQAASLVEDPAEQSIARTLIASAALQARQAGAFASAREMLTVAVDLLPPEPWAVESTATFALHTELHLVQFSLAHYVECDAVFEDLKLHARQPVVLVEPACIQVVSLSNRTRYADSVALSSQLLARLSVTLPAGDALVPAVLEELGLFYAYVKGGALERLARSEELTAPQQRAVGKLLSRTVPAAFFGQPLVSLWCILRGARLWADEGYFPEANYLMACVLLPAVAFGNDYANGYRAGRLSLDVGELRGPEAEVGRTRHVFALFNCHWFEPLESAVEHAREAHRTLRHLGDLENACFIFFTSLAGILECCARLKEVSAESDAAIAFCERTGNRHAQESFVSFRQLVRTLEGNTTEPGGFDDADFSESTHAQAVLGNPMAHAFYRAYRALSACLFEDAPTLIKHSEAGVELIPNITGFYPVALIQFLHCLAQLSQCASATAQTRLDLLEGVAKAKAWLAQRGADADMNFGHLHDLVEAEHLDVMDQPWQAHQSFERAMERSQLHQRAWHHAFIVERFALFQMRRGQEGTGRLLLHQAHRLYWAWGAHGKAQHMHTRWPFLGASPSSRISLPGTSQTSPSAKHTSHSSHTELDNTAILLASQSLSSETSLPRLVAILIEIVSKITGATGSAFLLSDDAGQWFLEGGAVGTQTLLRQKASACEGTAFSGAVMRLGLKIGKPVVSDDAVQDKRFARDAYFRGLPLCSVLGFPVLVRGRSTGFLVLENRLIHAAFSAEQVQTVSMLAGQLAISIENARLYESLETKVAERTRELEVSNAKLAALSSTDGLTGIANRRRFDEMLAIEWARAKRNRQPLSLAMLDVDWFKNYNDHYGHQAGDECLRQVARVFAANVRRSGDLVARYGGEEFVLIAPDTDKGAVQRLAAQACIDLAQLALPHALSPYGCVTASIGVATLVPKQQDDSPELLLKTADDSLYRAKAQGRNRAVA